MKIEYQGFYHIPPPTIWDLGDFEDEGGAAAAQEEINPFFAVKYLRFTFGEDAFRQRESRYIFVDPETGAYFHPSRTTFMECDQLAKMVIIAGRRIIPIASSDTLSVPYELIFDKFQAPPIAYDLRKRERFSYISEYAQSLIRRFDHAIITEETAKGPLKLAIQHYVKWEDKEALARRFSKPAPKADEEYKHFTTMMAPFMKRPSKTEGVE